MNAIEITSLSRHFGTIKAVNNLTLQVPEGTIYGFLGPNGAGKTTTINLLLGLIEPTTGSARVLGYDLKSQTAAIRGNVGVLFQDSGLYERLSVINNMKFYAKIWNLSSDNQQSRIQELLHRFGLWERKNEITAKLSAGMQRKLAIARTLIHRPKLIILDEPTAGLDPIARSILQDDIIDICAEEKSTFFITTHNLQEAEKICSQVAVINEGELVTRGSIDEIKQIRSTRQIEVVGKNLNNVHDALKVFDGLTILRASDSDLLLEVDPGIAPSTINKFIVSAGGLVDEFKEVGSSLEDIFLTLIGGNNVN